MTQTAQWSGSINTARVVKEQIAERWGEEEAEKYDPTENCFTFNAWRAKGYMVKKGEKALRSYTYIKEQAIDNDGNQQTIASHPKQVCLFFYLQVEKSKK